MLAPVTTGLADQAASLGLSLSANQTSYLHGGQ